MDPEAVTDRGLPRAFWWSRMLASVMAVSAIAGTWIAIGNWRQHQCQSNEGLASNYCWNLGGAQRQMQAWAVLAPDALSNGSFGFFSELCGAKRERNGVPLQWGDYPFLLSRSWMPDERGFVRRDGYVFVIFLPAADGGWVTEQDVANGRAVDEARAREQFLCYAWPERWAWTGRKVFLSGPSCVHCFFDTVGKYSFDSMPQPGVTGCIQGKGGPVHADRTKDGLGDLWYRWR